MKTIAEIDKTAYELARGYLPRLSIPGVSDALVELYLSPASLNPRPTTKQGIYQRILESAQNANMKAGVIVGQSAAWANWLRCWGTSRRTRSWRNTEPTGKGYLMKS